MTLLKISILLVAFLTSVRTSYAQFTQIPHTIPPLFVGSVALGDYDNDGDLDLLVTGNTPDVQPNQVLPYTGLYSNDGTGHMTVVATSLPNLGEGSVAWGDYDRDGDLDILLTGGYQFNNAFHRVAAIFRNDNGSFNDISAGLPGVTASSVAWGDCDGDGDLDVLITGNPGSTAISRIYRNGGNDIFTDVVAGLPGVSDGQSAFADYDNDGDLDLLITGNTGAARIARVYNNNGAAVFTEIPAGLDPVTLSAVDWADVNHDGKLDIVITGQPGWASLAGYVYLNQGGGVFQSTCQGQLIGGTSGAAIFGDYDNDGDTDIFMNGNNEAHLYQNNGSGCFGNSYVLDRVRYGAAAWGDLDGDKDLDLVQIGDPYDPNGNFTGGTYIYRNGVAAPNTSPTAPMDLEGTLNANQLVLSWSPSTDAQTPAANLYYNLRVGLTPGGSEIMAAMANPTTGYRRVPRIGNAQTGKPQGSAPLTWTLAVPSAPRYYFTVQAIDPAFVGSPFAPERVIDPANPPGWGSGGNGVAAGTFPAGVAVSDIQVLPDGSGGVYVLWSDNRSGAPDIYLQRVTGTGLIAQGWPNPGPLVVCNAANNQSQPTMCRDGTAGVYVCWSDGRTANPQSDIYAQRITPSGTIAIGWPANGKAICTAGDRQTYPRIASNGFGVVIAWADRRITLNGYISLFAQTVTSTGRALWQSNGVWVAHDPPNGFNVDEQGISIAMDSNSDAVLAWTLANRDLRFTRLRAADAVCLWNCPDVNGYYPPPVDTDCGQATIQAIPGGAYDLCYLKGQYAAADLRYIRISSQGIAGPTFNVSAAAGGQGLAGMVSDPTGGVVLGWWDQPSALVYAHRVYGGSILAPCWPVNGAVMTTMGASNACILSRPPALTSDFHGGALVVYDPVPGANGNDIMVGHVREDATADPGFPVPLCSAVGNQLCPAAATVNDGTIVGAWRDQRSGPGNDAVYVNKVSYTTLPVALGVSDLTLEGTPGWHSAGVQWTQPPSHPAYGAPAYFVMRSQGVTVDVVPATGVQGTPHCYPFNNLTQCTVYNFEVGTMFGCGHLSWPATVAGATKCDGSPEEPLFCDGGYFSARPRREEQSAATPDALAFSLSSRNPAAESVMFRVGVPEASRGAREELVLFDLLGRRVRTLLSDAAVPGWRNHSWDLRSDGGVPARAGVYYARYCVGRETRKQTVMIVK